VGPGIGLSAWKGGHLGTWLYVHEVGHQVVALYDRSVAPDFLFNHFSAWDGTAHRHGEHFDGNAWILREWAGYFDRSLDFPNPSARSGCRYSTCRWGEVSFPDDLDGDGLPDDAPELPVDEKRFGSRPDREDTDGDGLDDLAELMATYGLEFGHGEIWAGAPSRHRADPTNPDSDGDGIPDGKDEFPLIPFPPDLPRTKPVLDGMIGEGEYPVRIPLEDPEFSGEFFLGQRDEFLFVAGRFPVAPGEVKVLLDFNGDGWYCRFHNVDVRFRPGADPAVVVRNLCAAIPGCGPIFTPIGAKIACSPDGRVFEVRLDCTDPRIGVLLAAGPPGAVERHGMEGLLTVFEPHTFFRLECR
jgi:hypothetical protein